MCQFLWFFSTRYHNREAVIISALQVEKHPLTTPGPYATPPMIQRQFQNGACGSVALDYSSLHTMSRCSPIIGRAASCASGSLYNGSPKTEGYRQSPKPHSSPKMKLRFFQVAEHCSFWFKFSFGRYFLFLHFYEFPFWTKY